MTLDGKVIYEGSNDISNQRKAPIKRLLIGTADASDGLSDLFTQDNIRNSSGGIGAMADKDGIILRASNISAPNWFTLITTVNQADFGDNGREWKGVIIANQNYTVERIRLGAKYVVTTGDGVFGRASYAFFDPTDLTILVNQKYEIIWGIDQS